MDSKILLDKILQRFLDRGICKVEGYNQFEYLRETDDAVYVGREQGLDTMRNKFDVRLGESRDLPYPDSFADMVIMHGPLYHLQSKRDRERAIAEARRAVRPGGVVLGFSINYTASTLVGLLQGLIHRKPFFDMCVEELTSGNHNPPDDFPWMLADAYYHSHKN